MFMKKRTYQLVMVLSVLSIPYMQASLSADGNSKSNYGYCSGPGFSEPRGFGYLDDRQWRSEYGEMIKHERDAHLERSLELRRMIKAKASALAEELDLAEVDETRAVQLQKELSALKSQLELYHLERIIELRKKAPSSTPGSKEGKVE